jgi:hypothetical protein
VHLALMSTNDHTLLSHIAFMSTNTCVPPKQLHVYNTLYERKLIQNPFEY